MGVALFLCFLVLATTASDAVAQSDFKESHLLLPTARAFDQPDNGIDCLSWRLAVETNNIINWFIPPNCVNYIADYMLNKQYRLDCEAVADVAIKYAKSNPIPRDGRSIWIFDIDETALSTLPFLARPDVEFGTKPVNETMIYEYIQAAEAPAVPATLRLYKTVVQLGIKAVFITGAPERFREARIINLKRVGYDRWEKLVLRPETNGTEVTALVYKSQARDKLVASGYRILGNIGDQWSDILGTNVGRRTFKLPNPMYYVA